jgi:Zn-finger nucleic acid-binding protein
VASSTVVPTTEWSNTACPACRDRALHLVEARLHCLTCDGMFVPDGELIRALRELTPDPIRYFNERPGERACPVCSLTMLRCHITTATIATHIRRLPFELDRCLSHGVWFDGTELQAVLSSAGFDAPIEAFLRASRRLHR